MNAKSSVSSTSVLIVGGGLVGASLAIALDAIGITTTLVEAAAPHVGDQSGDDERNLALARTTVNGLKVIGVWVHAAPEATPIRHIHVSRAGEFGSTRIDALRHNVDALAWTLPARVLKASLLRRLADCTHLTRLAPARLEALEPASPGWRARICGEGDIRLIDAALVAGADGTESFVRSCLGIAAPRLDYGQTLFVTTVTPEHAHAQRAFERFCDDGPMALLPLTHGRCGLVITVPNAHAASVRIMDDAAFMALVQQRFGWSLGRLTCPGKRYAYLISRVIASRLSGPRAVLVGNAAQTIHPIGAQGFNLGFRDALTLSELIADGTDPGSADLLMHYAARRASDRHGTMAMSHGLVRLACLKQPALAPLRSLTLLACDRVLPLQGYLARRGMGFRGRLPRAVMDPLL